jgi:hypothetical protein
LGFAGASFPAAAARAFCFFVAMSSTLVAAGSVRVDFAAARVEGS